MMEIHSFVTQDSITLYWEKASKDEPDAAERWQILVDGKEAGIAEHTHYELDGLEPDREYRIQVYPVKSGSEAINIEDVPELALRTERAARRLDVTKSPYFAKGDGTTMDTKAIRQAIDDCGKGETVYFPSGIYLTGALRLHSDMELYLEEGAVLQGTDVPEDYLPRIWSRFEGTELSCYSSLLNMGELDRNGGYNCRNVIIRGKGRIASGGRVLAERVIAAERERLKDYLASLGDKINECEKPETIPGRVRPRLINISNCQNIVISGVTLANGASWNVHIIYSDNIVTSGCTFYSEDVWNGDGWDPDSSTNCSIFGCTFYTGDDSVAIKSGKNPEGNEVNRPSAHIRVFDCKCAFGHGICIGSEMSGGVEDVKIWDCDLGNSLCGIEIKGTKKRGGYVRDVQVSDCVVPRILFHSVGYNDDGIAAPVPPFFEDCSFKGVRILGECYGYDRKTEACEAIELCGFDVPGHELKNIVFEDITIGREGVSRKQSISLRLCEDITLRRVRCL